MATDMLRGLEPPDQQLIKALLAASSLPSLQAFGVEYFQRCTGLPPIPALTTLLRWSREGLLNIMIEVRCTNCESVYPEFFAPDSVPPTLECHYCWDHDKDAPTVFRTFRDEDSYFLFGFSTAVLEDIIGVMGPALLGSASSSIASSGSPGLTEYKALQELARAFEEAIERGDRETIRGVMGSLEFLAVKHGSLHANRVLAEYRDRLS